MFLLSTNPCIKEYCHHCGIKFNKFNRLYMGLVRVDVGNNKLKEEIISSWKSTLAIHETDLRLPQKSALFKCLDYDVNDE